MPQVQVVVAIKPWSRSKSRFADLDPRTREQLARAMALDAIEVLGSLGPVLVVGSDAETAPDLIPLGVRLMADPGGGLNHALAAAARSVEPEPGGLLLASVADLPALDGRELAALTGTLPIAGRGFVADADGIGTTMLLARDRPLDPLFEGASAARHRASGAAELPAGSTLRADVDDLASLHAAAALGLGPRTAEVLASLPDGPGAPGSSAG